MGVGYVLDYFRGHVKAAPYDVQASLIDTLRGRGVLSGRSSRPHFTPYQIPVGGPLARTNTDRVVLTGDAGGFVNGITAEGIYYAMVSGELAARALIGSGAGPALAGLYARLADREIGSELRDSVLIRRYLFADRRRIARLVTAARRRAATTRLILEFAKGRYQYPELRRRLLARFPGLAARLAWELVVQLAETTKKGVVARA